HEKAACQGTVLELLPAGEHVRTARAKLGHVTREILVRGLHRHRTQPVPACRRISDGERAELSEELCDERLGDLTVHVQPGEGRAFLAAHTERGTEDAACRPLEIGACGHDAGILAAHLGDAGLRVGTALELAGDLSADLEGACEGHPGSERMLDERRADRATRAGKIVEYARWNFCVT